MVFNVGWELEQKTDSVINKTYISEYVSENGIENRRMVGKWSENQNYKTLILYSFFTYDRRIGK